MKPKPPANKPVPVRNRDLSRLAAAYVQAFEQLAPPDQTLLVQGAHYILGPFGEDSDLRRWGKKLALRGGKNAKKRAVVAVARKLAVLLHRLWLTGEVYEPLHNSQKAMSPAA